MNKNLYQVCTPEELKSLSSEELKKLAVTLKNDIVQHTSVNGGHIGASVCCIEMIIAMHKIFNTPDDCFVFDVGHQAYAHKMLTGRRFQFYNLRKENGVSGFVKRSESKHDSFGAGHASTAVSAALGILEGKKLTNDPHHVVAVVGDGALTGGLTFEGLNHAGDLKRNLIVVINDNQMSIDPNVGALKEAFEENKARDFFNVLGFDYWGPHDGHDVDNLIDLFGKAKESNGPVVLHLNTIKGRGYEPAIKDKIRFHGCGPYDIETGNAIKSPNAKKKYQDIFAETLNALAGKDELITGITAAMPTGTSLKKFQKVHPTRFYDVGLAEPHAVEFGCGLATQGVKPFVCIYSTFLQRAYDQLIHDVGIQKLPVRICMDRGGVVGDDGHTHQGVFDYAYLRSIPNFVVMAPKDEAEMQHMMETARCYEDGPITLRFPRGEVKGVPLPSKLKSIPIGKAEHLYGNLTGDCLVIAIGNPVHDAVEAAKQLEHDYKIEASVINLRFAKPLDEKMILDFAANFKSVITVEEGVLSGGVGSSILELFSKHLIDTPTQMLGIPDEFIAHASQDRQRQLCQIDKDAIVNNCVNLLQRIEDNAKGKNESNVTKLPLRAIANHR
ncbi:1-deoxy-D-xylulose-5-phosphate synthase [bacterium K02(2017)]|nr:1-deoxy-D-xylulose-5-phosphate synthase [bacterium K02(2017)]